MANKKFNNYYEYLIKIKTNLFVLMWIIAFSILAIVRSYGNEMFWVIAGFCLFVFFAYIIGTYLNYKSYKEYQNYKDKLDR